jgi:hypothetical protein
MTQRMDNDGDGRIVIEQEGEVNSKEKGMDNDGDGAEMGMADI